MAIHTPDPAAPQGPQPIDIETWTEQATVALGTVSLSTPADTPAGPATAGLQIPLDDVEKPVARVAAAAKEGGSYKRKELVRRDSMKRREALMKGKEGSKRRLRWENDRLLNNPYVEPPQPRDWEVHPTHTVRNVPYYLAPLWDAGLARQSAERKTAAHKAAAASKMVANKPNSPDIVPKELREKLKRSRGARGLLMDLEGEVRKFVEEWEDKERRAEADGLPADPDSSDDEIVFVGRNGKMSDAHSPTSKPPLKREMMLFDTPEDDHGGAFGRWLVHHIGIYYGLQTWSVTVGRPARREAYIGLKESRLRSGRKASVGPMPRPLWVLV